MHQNFFWLLPKMDHWELLEPVDISSKLTIDFESNKWQERKEAMDELFQLLTQNPRLADSPKYREVIERLTKAMANDSNINVVTSAAKCMAGFAKGLRAKFAPHVLLVLPVIFGKFKEKKQILRDALIECVDAVFASTTLDHLSNAMLEALASKQNPSQKCQLDLFIYRIFRSLAPKDVPKGFLKDLVAALSKHGSDADPEVRDSSFAALGAIMKCIGEKSLSVFLTPELVKDANKMAKDKAQSEAAAMLSLTMMANAHSDCGRTSTSSAKENAFIIQNNDEMDHWELLEPVDISSKLTIDFESNKWQERKEAMDELFQLLTQNPRLADSPKYREVIERLTKAMANDSNINVVTSAAKCMAGFAKGLRAKFAPHVLLVLPVIFGKFKEKKQILRDALIECVDAVFASTTLDHLSNAMLEALASKQNPSQKCQLDLFIYRIFRSLAPKDVPKGFLKDLVAALSKHGSDADPEVRDSSFAALGAIMKCIGEKSLSVFLTPELVKDANKMAKDKAQSEAAAMLSLTKPKKQQNGFYPSPVDLPIKQQRRILNVLSPRADCQAAECRVNTSSSKKSVPSVVSVSKSRPFTAPSEASPTCNKYSFDYVNTPSAEFVRLGHRQTEISLKLKTAFKNPGAFLSARIQALDFHMCTRMIDVGLNLGMGEVALRFSPAAFGLLSAINSKLVEHQQKKPAKTTDRPMMPDYPNYWLPKQIKRRQYWWFKRPNSTAGELATFSIRRFEISLDAEVRDTMRPMGRVWQNWKLALKIGPQEDEVEPCVDAKRVLPFPKLAVVIEAAETTKEREIQFATGKEATRGKSKATDVVHGRHKLRPSLLQRVLGLHRCQLPDLQFGDQRHCVGSDRNGRLGGVYLMALAVSDFLMICTAMFLFVLEAWRHHGPMGLAYAYGVGAPFFFPLASIFQTTSVYFCVGAAIDLFVSVALRGPISESYCTVRIARKFVLITACLAVLYNIPHFFELRSIDCFETRDGLNVRSLQICPTEFRMSHVYYSIYYTYMYTVFMAVGPLVLLIVLNICIVVNVLKRPHDPDSDIISLILVVFLFIFCNFTALLVNFLELTFSEQLKHVIVYLVDLSNLLVVINCTANFFVYLIFGNSFRRTLREICFGKAPPGVGTGGEMANGGARANLLVLMESEEGNRNGAPSNGQQKNGTAPAAAKAKTAIVRIIGTEL
uniref:G-protein coupled receptors family 1 profile domain-containing protein n=1 Tax=Globodera rostochiensis TaxID=31243 RepID=A0A914HZS0_GLORO